MNANRSLRLSCTVAIFLICAGASLSCSQEPSQDDPKAHETRSRFLKAPPGVSKGAAAAQLLNGRTAQEIQTLCFDDDPSVALCAAWHRVQMQMRGQLVGSDRGATLVPIPTYLSREFLGFIEGRLHIPAPDQWSKDLQKARYSRWGSTLFPATQLTVENVEEQENDTSGTSNRSALPQVLLSLTSSPAYATFVGREPYEGHDAVVKLPDDIIRSLKDAQRDVGGDIVVTGLAADGRAVLALPGDGPETEELVCLTITGSQGIPKTLWRCEMDSYWADVFKGSSWYTEFRFAKGLLYLFHCTHSSIGIECIKLSDGVRVFSFNSRLP